MIFCSRTMPTLVMEQIVLVPQCDLDDVSLRASLDIRSLPLQQRMQVGNCTDGCEMLMHVEARGGNSTAGIAVKLDCSRTDFIRKQQWGYESDYTAHVLRGKASAGEKIIFTTYTSYVPSTMHSEPHLQAVRMIKMALWNGFDSIRKANKNAWTEIWKGCPVIKGADPRWQDVIEASYFYLYSTMHSSAPYGIAPYGLGQRHAYKGHVFWDCESFMFMVPLLTDPHIAEAMLDYRFDRLEAARNNARLNGYLGVQFPWQSLSSGDEVTRVSAGQAGGAGEQHINMDVAMTFAAYSYVSGDAVFLKEKAWPVVSGVAKWIESRVTKTERGYEILHVCGIDESKDNVDNDGFTNIMCSMVLREANKMAVKLGYCGHRLCPAQRRDLLLPLQRRPVPAGERGPYRPAHSR